MASYFAISKVSRIQDGLVALSLYQEYRLSRDKNRRVVLKMDLLEYNRDDLEALAGVAERLVSLQSGRLKVSPARRRGGKRTVLARDLVAGP
ncbi:MAG: hypothetical protein HYZ50_11965 [Deltaproteobacteria bacterium]|nr:hypothetical protein [Deltaproteobacteria bacterium]